MRFLQRGNAEGCELGEAAGPVLPGDESRERQRGDKETVGSWSAHSRTQRRTARCTVGATQQEDKQRGQPPRRDIDTAQLTANSHPLAQGQPTLCQRCARLPF